MASPLLIAQGITRRRAILRYLTKYIAKHGYSPSYQEIADEVGLASKSAARHHLGLLQEEGLIVMSPQINRSVRVVEQDLGLRKAKPVGKPALVKAKPRR